ncbi:MAG: phage tail tape measure protein [Proteobacteria bacterium]|nr:phage tail tape measure protein [Pseudomonadota bacterium]MBU1640071.1 phage tail tape measure protein [Pseudomonadota bacterium]
MAENLSLGVRIGAALSSGFNTALGGAREKFNILGKEIKDLSAQRGLVERVEKDRAALEKARLGLTATRAKVQELKLALHKDPANAGLAKELTTARTKLEKLSTSLDKHKGKLRSSEGALQKAGVKVGDLAHEYTRLGASLDKTRLKFDKMQAHMAKKSAAGQRLGEMKGQILGMAGAVYAAGKLIGQASSFETAEVRLSTVINTKDLPGDLAAARKHALDFSRKNLSTETEMIDIQYALSSAGLDAEASRMGSDIVAKVATITNGSAEGVGEVIATVFNNMGGSLEGSTQERMQRIGELLTKTQFKFQIRNFDQLGESLKMATPELSKWGVELDQGLTLLGALNSSGLQGSMAGTALSATFRQLSKASEEFNFDIARSADGNLDFVTTMENLSASIGGFDNLDQDTIDRMQKAFGDEGQRAVVLLGKKLGDLRIAQQDVAEGSKGLIDKSYQRFLDSTAGQTTLLTNNLRILGTTFAATLLPAVNAVITPLIATAKWAGALIERFPWLGKLVGGLAVLLGAAVGGLVAVTAATWLWNVALLANPIGLTIAAIALAAGLIITYWEPITGFFADIWSGIKEQFSTGVKFLTTIWELSPLGLLFKAGQALGTLVGGLLPQESDGPGPGMTMPALARPGGGDLQMTSNHQSAPTSARQFPQVQTAGSGRQQTTVDASVHAPITIHAAPGMDAKQVADEVDRKLRQRESQAQARQRGALHD